MEGNNVLRMISSSWLYPFHLRIISFVEYWLLCPPPCFPDLFHQSMYTYSDERPMVADVIRSSLPLLSFHVFLGLVSRLAFFVPCDLFFFF